jgi:threonine/homoserine/homoserine lactone efflux protein
MVGPVPELSTLAVFAAAALALLVVASPSVLYIVASSAEHGRRAGLASVAGVHAGSMVHVVAAAAGLSAILVRSAVAFQVLKYAGATDGAYALVAASVATRLRPALRTKLRWTGAVYLALGASAARATR